MIAANSTWGGLLAERGVAAIYRAQSAGKVRMIDLPLPHEGSASRKYACPGELSPLFVIGAQGDGQLVNYRFRPPYYIVDRLFGAAELRLGGIGAKRHRAHGWRRGN